MFLNVECGNIEVHASLQQNIKIQMHVFKIFEIKNLYE